MVKFLLLDFALLLLVCAALSVAADLEEATKVGNKYFYYDGRNKGDVDVQMSWEEALAYCNKNNMNLATIRNKAESDAVSKFVKKFGRPVFLGGSDKLSEGSWYWQHNKKPISYKNWGAGEPAAGEYNNCIYMTSNDGKWKANYCDVAFSRPLCEDVKSG